MRELPGGIRDAVEVVVGPVRAARSVAGGDINAAFALEGAFGRAFLKTREGAAPGTFRLEAEGLEWLREADALPVPAVLAWGEDPAFLLLEWIEPGRPRAGWEERFGRGLARLHRHGAPSFGWREDNDLGSLRLSGEPEAAWPTFYARRRLLPLAEDCGARGLLGAEDRARLEALAERLPLAYPEEEAPARLHGDLWAGNALLAEGGEAWLIDPAVLGGHRELDLAMMRLFGGFPPGVYRAYAEEWPLAPGAEERVPLHQLLPLLVHLRLFGAGWKGRFLGALNAAERVCR